MGGYVYILASKRNVTIYIGVTSDLVRRIYEHRQEVVDGFSKRHGVKNLVHFEYYDAINDAIQREKNLKKWPREWKLNLVERLNPNWHDLYLSIASG